MRRFGFVSAIVIIAVFMTVSTASAYLFRYDGTYKGRIIDAETKEPIEGVVVLGVWYNEEPNVAGSTSTYYDASETVTDENGEFSISGKGLQLFSHVGYMSFLIFKAGYQYESGPWPSLKVGLIYRDTIKWEGSRAIIPLKKLTMEERKKQGTPDFYIGEKYDKKENMSHSCLPKNIIFLPKEVNKELLEQGRKPYDLEGGWCEK